MSAVRVLPSDLIDQIAAGEVVERPSSVVKELLENAFDAEATSVRIDIEQGGLTLIRVSDDGTGMSRADAALAVHRHATSKIARFEDLSALRSLGFRGEALPSIASVSRFCLRTRPRTSEVGIEVTIEGGSEPRIEEIGCAPGTSITVTDLFWNVPARKKFVRSVGAESSQIRDVVVRASLARPDIKLTLTRDRRPVLELPATTDLAQRAALVFAEDRLQPIEGERDGVHVRALLGAPERARSGATHLFVYVNGRPVRDRALARSISFAYGSVLPSGRYPAGVVHIDLDPKRVDVNVHPQKSEVRFEDARGTLDAITRVLAHGLGSSAFRGPAARGQDFWASRLAIAPPLEAGSEPDPWGLTVEPTEPRTKEEPIRALSDAPRPYPLPAHTVPRVAEHAPLLTPLGFFASLRFIGQAQRTYLICEGDDGLYIIDQHAADERVRFEQLREAQERSNIAVQRLLLPERVEVTAAEATLADEASSAMATLGVEAVRIGDTTLAVHAIPALLGRASPARLIRDLLAELAKTGGREFGDALDTALATMACHGAIRAGDMLDAREVRALLQQLDQVTDFARHCPHGRPVVSELSFAELARRVGR